MRSKASPTTFDSLKGCRSIRFLECPVRSQVATHSFRAVEDIVLKFRRSEDVTYGTYAVHPVQNMLDSAIDGRVFSLHLSYIPSLV